jgi:hypothetical protein
MHIDNGDMDRTELACDTVISTLKENLVFLATRNSVSGHTNYQMPVLEIELIFVDFATL